jgi:hypothetical protein
VAIRNEAMAIAALNPPCALKNLPVFIMAA